MATLPGVISYPIPPYQNLPIEPQFYEPWRFSIANITLGLTTLVTTTLPHNYVIGQNIRLLIPPSFGCYELNDVQGIVISIPSTTQVETSIDSLTNVSPFIASSDPIQDAQIIPVGDFNSGQINSSGRVNNLEYIPGSFINVSPE